MSEGEGTLFVRFTCDPADNEEISVRMANALRELGDTVDVQSLYLTLPPEAGDEPHSP